MNDCEEWGGVIRRDGYGQVLIAGRLWLAHRAAWYSKTGQEPEALHHKCGNRRCVNTEHLQPTTFTEHQILHRTGLKMEECRKGHPFTPENTMEYKGKRQCRTCYRETNRKAVAAYREKRKCNQ